MGSGGGGGGQRKYMLSLTAIDFTVIIVTLVMLMGIVFVGIKLFVRKARLLKT